MGQPWCIQSVVLMHGQEMDTRISSSATRWLSVPIRVLVADLFLRSWFSYISWFFVMRNLVAAAVDDQLRKFVAATFTDLSKYGSIV